MAIRNPNWYDLNTVRPYPLDDSATAIDDAGQRMPSNIISGLYVTFPESAGQYAYLGAVSISSSLVTVVILAASTPSGDSAVPLASVTLRKPIERDRQYPLEAMYPGVGGWIVFGEGIMEGGDDYQSRFSTAAQALLSPRVARWYEELPISSVAKLGNAEALTGLVLLRGGNDIEIVKECREIPLYSVPSHDPVYCGDVELGSAVRDVIVFRLVSKTIPQENVHDKYKGRCGARPENYNCGAPEPIEYLGAVPPDCCGNILLEFKGCAVASEITHLITDPYDMDEVPIEACGVVLDCSLGMIESCVKADRLPDADGKLPNEYDDLCESVSIEDESIGPEDEEPSFSFDPEAAFAYSESGLPFVDDFTEEKTWQQESGEFDWDIDDGLFLAMSLAMQNLATYNPAPPVESAYYKEATGRFYIESGYSGALHNGGVVINYRNVEGSSRKQFYTAQIDWDGYYLGYKLFRIARYTGLGWVTEQAVSVPGLALDDTYEISFSAFPQTNPDNAWLIARLVGIDDPSIDIEIGPLAVSNFAPTNGKFGLEANRSATRFLNFTLTNL